MKKDKNLIYSAKDYIYSILKVHIPPTKEGRVLRGNTDTHIKFKINLIEFNDSFFLEDIADIDSEVLKIIQSKIDELKSKNKPVPIPSKYLNEFTGKFMLRLSPELHRQLFIEAVQLDVSLNKLITKKLERN